jgi:replicative DNA helicase
MTPAFVTGSDLLGAWVADVERGEPPARFAIPAPFDGLDVRPGAGKTAALLQVGVDLLRVNPTARLLIANVEMSPLTLADRIVSRLSGVPLTAITDRTLTADRLDRVRAAVESLGSAAARLAFLSAPFSLEHIAAAGTAFDANVVMIDYVQRVVHGSAAKDGRERLEAIAAVLRGFCDAGAAVLVASAVARQKSKSGSTYSGLNLASFRGSSELEYGADDAYLHEPGEGGLMTLKCEKNRHAPPADISAEFDPIVQTFRPAPAGPGGFDAAAPAQHRGHSKRRGML